MADKITETTAIMNELLGAFDKISRSQLLFVKDMTAQHESLKSSHAQISTKVQNLLKNIADANIPKPENKIVQIVPKESKKRFVRDSSEERKEKQRLAKLDNFFFKKGSAFKDLSSKSITISKSQIYIGKTNLPIGQIQKQSQSDLNYAAHDDVDPLELEQVQLLKEIRDRIGDVSGHESEDSLFGMLLGGFKDIASTIGKVIGGAGLLGGAGLAGAAGAGLFSKFKFLSKFVAPMKKFGGIAGKGGKAILSLVKNPKVMIPMLGAGLLWGTYKALNGDAVEEMGTAEQRMFGGPVDKNKLYVVGEKGPEFFRPDTAGTIIPMDPNDKEVSEILGYNKRLFRRITNIVSNIKDKFENFVNLFTFQNLKKMITNIISSGVTKVKDTILGIGAKIKNFGTAAKDKAVSIISNTMNFMSGGSNIMNMFSQPQTVVNPLVTPKFSFGGMKKPQIGGSYRIGTGRVPRDMNAQIHKGEMIFPKDMSDMLRAAAPLGEMLKAVATLNNTKTGSITLENNSRQVLPREFWMTVFIPKFADMIKTKKVRPDSYMQTKISNVFGVN
jgi:hypothetical protein